MNICVFCSANEVDEKYSKPIETLAQLIGQAGHTLLWGGSNRGLMKVIADGVKAQNGKIVGVTIDLFKDFSYKDADEMIVAPTLHERKELLTKRADAIVVLPGGLGTLDELTELAENKRQGTHNCNIVILNTDGFYDGLKTQLQRIAREGFLPVTASELEAWVQFVDAPEEVLGCC